MKRVLLFAINLFMLVILNGCINQQTTHFVTIQFDTLGGGYVDTQVVEQGERRSLPRTIKEGHTLIGWYISFNDGETFDEAGFYTINLIPSPHP